MDVRYWVELNQSERDLLITQIALEGPRQL